MKFNSASVAGDSSTNAELETSSNWTRVYENKNVRIVAVTHFVQLLLSRVGSYQRTRSGSVRLVRV